MNALPPAETNVAIRIKMNGTYKIVSHKISLPLRPFAERCQKLLELVTLPTTLCSLKMYPPRVCLHTNGTLVQRQEPPPRSTDIPLQNIDNGAKNHASEEATHHKRSAARISSSLWLQRSSADGRRNVRRICTDDSEVAGRGPAPSNPTPSLSGARGQGNKSWNRNSAGVEQCYGARRAVYCNCATVTALESLLIKLRTRSWCSLEWTADDAKTGLGFVYLTKMSASVSYRYEAGIVQVS